VQQARNLKIILRNNLRLVDVPAGLHQFLIDTFTLQNPKWVDNVRMGRWNRGVPKFLKLYAKAPHDGLWIPRGYLRQLILRCRRKQLAFEIEDRRNFLPEAPLPFRGQLKPFQGTAVEKMLARDFGTLSAPTGSGKTVMALHIIAQRKQPALVIVHTKDLAHQWVERIETFLGLQAHAVGFIGGGKRTVGNHITVALVQSLYRCADEIAPRIGHVIVDECHRIPSRTFTEAVTEFDSRYMLGLSATPWRRDGLSKLIFWHLGDVHHEIDHTRLVAEGHILAAKVIVRETNFKPIQDPINAYSKMLSELTEDDERNRLIAQDVASALGQTHGTCLVLSDRKRHCETLQALLKFKHKVAVTCLTGDVPIDQRRQIIAQLNQGQVRVLVATGQLVGEGFDCKNLSTLFLATPIRFSGRLLQYLGRILRPSDDQTLARVYDYVDVHVDPLRAAYKARQRVYDR
jgi:superfamily II DNA or RNA helicase